MDLRAWIVRKETSGKCLRLQKPRRNTRQAKKKTEKTLVRVIAPGVKTVATDEDPQVEIVEMEVEENWVISLKQLHLNQSRLMIASLKHNLQTRCSWP